MDAAARVQALLEQLRRATSEEHSRIEHSVVRNKAAAASNNACDTGFDDAQADANATDAALDDSNPSDESVPPEDQPSPVAPDNPLFSETRGDVDLFNNSEVYERYDDDAKRSLFLARHNPVTTLHSAAEQQDSNNVSQRLSSDHAVYERDRLRKELDASVARERSLRHEISKLHQQRGAESAEADELRSRTERAETVRDKLYSEHEETHKQSTQLSAHESMHNDVLNKLHQEKERSNALEKERDALRDSLNKLQQERDKLESTKNDYVHAHDMLQRDKAHLSAEIEHYKEEQRKHEGDNKRLKDELQSAHAAKDELQQRILSKGSEERSNYEAKLESELNSLRQTMQAEAEKRKADAKAHEDRELETMRELRDAARDEAQQLRKELKDTRAEYEELLTQHRALQSQSDSSAAAAQGQLRVKEFETERLQAIRSEQQDALQELRAENEKLQKKCNYLESEYHRLEGSASRQAADLQSQLADAHSRLQQYEELEQDLDAEVESNGESMHLQYMPTSFQRRLKHSRQLAQKASQLEEELASERSRRQSAEQEKKRVEAEASRLREQGQMAHQPVSYLVQKVHDAEAEVQNLRSERDSALNDLKELLEGRQSLTRVEEMLQQNTNKANVSSRKPHNQHQQQQQRKRGCNQSRTQNQQQNNQCALHRPAIAGAT